MDPDNGNEKPQDEKIKEKEDLNEINPERKKRDSPGWLVNVND